MLDLFCSSSMWPTRSPRPWCHPLWQVPRLCGQPLSAHVLGRLWCDIPWCCARLVHLYSGWRMVPKLLGIQLLRWEDGDWVTLLGVYLCDRRVSLFVTFFMRLYSFWLCWTIVIAFYWPRPWTWPLTSHALRLYFFIATQIVHVALLMWIALAGQHTVWAVGLIGNYSLNLTLTSHTFRKLSVSEVHALWWTLLAPWPVLSCSSIRRTDWTSFLPHCPPISIRCCLWQGPTL